MIHSQSMMEYWPALLTSLEETGIMMAISMGVCVVGGLPLGLGLFLANPKVRGRYPWIYWTLNFLVTVIRSFPYLLFVIALIPVTRAILGKAFGPIPASVPLSIIAITIFARLVEQVLLDVSDETYALANSLGTTRFQYIWHFLLVEARSGLVLAYTTTTVSMVSYSTVMGVIGGGGIGDFAVRVGYQRYEYGVMYVAIVIMIVLVSSKDILEIAKKEVEKQGYTIDIMEVSDNVAYNDAVQHDEADANFAQHEPFMEMFNQEKKADLVAVQPIYYFAGGFYSKNYKNADQLPKNAKVGIPSDPTNEGRALAILNKNGVIKLKDNIGFNGTVADIVDNPKNLQFERIDLLNLVKAYDENDIAMVFCYPAYLEPAGLSTKDAILLEDEAASKHYALQLVTREGEKDSEKINVLKKAMTTKEVAEYIKKNSKGANIPAF